MAGTGVAGCCAYGVPQHHRLPHGHRRAQNITAASVATWQAAMQAWRSPCCMGTATRAFMSDYTPPKVPAHVSSASANRLAITAAAPHRTIAENHLCLRYTRACGEPASREMPRGTLPRILPLRPCALKSCLCASACLPEMLMREMPRASIAINAHTRIARPRAASSHLFTRHSHRADTLFYACCSPKSWPRDIAREERLENGAAQALRRGLWYTSACRCLLLRLALNIVPLRYTLLGEGTRMVEALPALREAGGGYRNIALLASTSALQSRGGCWRPGERMLLFASVSASDGNLACCLRLGAERGSCRSIPLQYDSASSLTLHFLRAPLATAAAISEHKAAPRRRA